MTTYRVQAPSTGARQDWRSSYTVAVANAAFFWALSGLSYVFAPGFVELHSTIAILFAAGSAFAFYRMVLAGGLTAIACFVLGTGIIFGFGTFYSTIADNIAFQMFFDTGIQERDLAEINLVNATSVCIVLFTAWILCGRSASAGGGEGLDRILILLDRVWTPILVVSVAILLLRIMTFPVPDNLLLRGSLAKLHPLVWLAVLLGASRWHRLSSIGKLGVFGVTAVEVMLGFLTLSKTDIMMPLAAFNAGLFLDKRARWVATALGFAILVGYFTLVGPLVEQGRYLLNRSAGTDSLEQRISIVSQILQGRTDIPMQAATTASTLLTRFSAAPYQSYLINEYREGRPGDTLSDAWIALVPRVLWADKPNITAVAGQFYAKVFGGEETSALAPTYTAEAYWNYGWIGVVIVSVILGLEFGWLSRMWLDFMNGLTANVGILVFAVPVAFMAFWVETWIVPSYVGGFVTLVVLIKLFNFGFASLVAGGAAGIPGR